MTGKKYSGYSVDELLHDHEFVLIVLGMTSKEEWDEFLQSNHESKDNILKAKKIIRLFIVQDGKLDDAKKSQLWENISRYNIEVSGNNKLFRIRALVKIAASLLIILSIGGLLYLNLKPLKNQYQFSEISNDSKSKNPLLVLSNGKKVDLQKTESKITVLKGQNAIQINNDTVVENRIAIDKNTNRAKLNEVIIPFGKKSNLVLGDGTKVWLNAGSRLAFPSKFDGNKREVYLDGEAYFEVVKNVKQPFVVSTNSVNVEVLGTKFNVSAYHSDDFCETVLLEGSVNFCDKDKLFSDKVLVSPNQRITYSKTSKEIVLKSEPDAAMYVAWVEGWYPFKNESIEQVIRKIERFYNVKFEYDQKIISGSLPVSGKLDLKNSMDEVMVILSKVAKFNYVISGNSVLIVNDTK